MNPKKQISFPTLSDVSFEPAIVMFHHIAESYMDKYIPMPKMVLSRRERSEAIMLLMDMGAVERKEYKKGVIPYTYKPVFTSKVVNYSINTETDLYKRLKKELKNRKAHHNRIPKHLKAMEEAFMDLQFDYDGMLDWITFTDADAEKKRAWVFSIESLKHNRYFKRNKTNYRLDTNLTNLKSELRKFIKGDYVEIDLSNSQPFFLGLILKYYSRKKTSKIFFRDLIDIKGNTNTKHDPLVNIYLNDYQQRKVKRLESLLTKGYRVFSTCHQKQVNGVFGEQLKRYFELTGKGIFYEEVFKQLGLKNRSEAKEIMFQILFSKNEHFEQNKKKFTEIFPLVESFTSEFKSRDHTQLAILLQTLESFVFIDIVSALLFENGITPLTVHDSVIVEYKQAVRAQEIIQSIINPSLKVKPMKQLYRFAWKDPKNPKWVTMFGRQCEVLARGAMNSRMIRFIDNGQREIINGYALRKVA